MSKLKQIIVAGLMLATTIVLSRFLSIKTPILVISFSFVPIIMCGILLGPWWTMLIAGLSDLIGALLFPFGAYFVGYTISAAISGFIYGAFLKYKEETSYKKFILLLTIACLIVTVVCNSLLNSLWIYLTTKKALYAILPTRLLKEFIMLPIQIVTIFSIHLGLKKVGIYGHLFGRPTDFNKQKEITKIENKTKSKHKNKQVKTKGTSSKEVTK